jgi:hypothetical protein
MLATFVKRPESQKKSLQFGQKTSAFTVEDQENLVIKLGSLNRCQPLCLGTIVKFPGHNSEVALKVSQKLAQTSPMVLKEFALGQVK